MADANAAWTALCCSLGCDTAQCHHVWSELLAAYAEPWRRYHTLDHIGALLALRRAHADLFRDLITIDLAILLHDVVYDPQRGDNEERSAVWARARLADLGVDAARTDAVAHAIEMSRHDADSLASIDPASDIALFLDLDLSILAADAADYAAYARGIRQEYAIYPDTAYRQGRVRVLSGFLARPFIYCSAHFRAAWEARARTNIADEIGRLTS